MEKINTEDLLNLYSFMSENSNVGGISEEQNTAIEQLVLKYRQTELSKDCTIITADVGRLGSIILRNVIDFDEEITFKYESGSYDYIDIKYNTQTTILWTDFATTEPYNRQSGLYADGMSFERLGEPIKITDDYREFYCHESDFISNICFAVWGYRFNDFYKSVRFGICIKDSDVDTFITQLRSILNK